MGDNSNTGKLFNPYNRTEGKDTNLTTETCSADWVHRTIMYYTDSGATGVDAIPCNSHLK